MNNYYKEIIQEIEQHIALNEQEQALEKLYVELSMPYIPQEHQAVFESLLHKIKQSQNKAVPLFTDIESIKEALFSNELQVVKALQSLENMNLRSIEYDLLELLKSDLDDIIKRMILLQMLEQQMHLELQIKLKGEYLTLCTQDLLSPFESEHYQKVYQELVENYESVDPSYLNLALEVLNIEMMESFPFIDTSIDRERIITKLNDYLKIV